MNPFNYESESKTALLLGHSVLRVLLFCGLWGFPWLHAVSRWVQKLKRRMGQITNIGSSSCQAVTQASRLGMQLKAVEVAFHACRW